MFLSEKFKVMALVLASVGIFFVPGKSVLAASLSLSPNGGTHEVGSTFDVSIMLNSEGQNINAVKVLLSFSPDVLQVVSPSTGNSSVHLWASPPKYDNRAGTIALEGGFPNGTNLTNGLISKITFRVNGIGTTIVKFLDDSEVFLNDGKGTKTLNQTNNGIYNLVLPPPVGPEVVSETHPDQSRWYRESSVILKWADSDPEMVKDYSYIINDIPNDTPDDIAEGKRSGISYNDISNGRQYFHIKALNKNGVWGGTTHYALNIDSDPPSDFSIDISPSVATSRRNIFAQFITTDRLSGIDHYELRVLPLSKADPKTDADESQNIFIDVNSPHIIENLDLGRYDVVVRAYDAAGNYAESVQKIKISNAFFQFAGKEGLVVGGKAVISWIWIISILIAIAAAMAYILMRIKHCLDAQETGKYKDLPPEIKQDMEELKMLKNKYKGLVMMILIILSSLFFGSFADAESEASELEVPIITTISKNISNNEIFYIGGRTKVVGASVDIFVKNTGTEETFSKEIVTDEKGEWFYRHDKFLQGGHYILWAQSKKDNQSSPPSPQVEMHIEKAALQFGISRISYETLLLLIVCALLLIIVATVIYIGFFIRKISAGKRAFKKEVDEIEDAVCKGFMILHREISKELKLMEESMGNKKNISGKEEAYRAHLMKDIDRIERHIEKEIADVEKLLD